MNENRMTVYDNKTQNEERRRREKKTLSRKSVEMTTCMSSSLSPSDEKPYGLHSCWNYRGCATIMLKRKK